MNKKTYSGQTTIKTQLTKLVLTIAFFALTFVSLTFVDPIGNINNDGLFSNILKAILSAFGYSQVNITQPAWETLFVGFGILLAGIVVYLLLPLIFNGAYKRVVNNKLSKKILVDLLMFTVIIVVVALIFFGVILSNNDQDMNTEVLWVTLIVALSLLLGILTVTTIIYAIFKIFKGIETVISTQISSKNAENENAKIAIFPTLEESDKKFENYNPNQVYPEAPSLEVIANKFQAYIATVHRIYFDIDVIRSYIAGIATSKIVLLEGLSGTGKSTLPRRFMEFIGGESEFISVQSTWKDRADLIGYYNDFTSNFKETRFLKTLYENNYKSDKISTIVLDEVNLSRVEYYFADFISAMEFPVDMRYIELMQPISGRKMPKKLEEGKIHVPENTFFVGTANKDESTYTITERVYDRAIVINFEEKHTPFETEKITEPIKVSYKQFEVLVNEAKRSESGRLTNDEKARFDELYNFISKNFDIQVGDRIFAQLDTFTAVYTACGGNKYRALDVMFANKFIRKLNNSFDDSISENLDKLVALIDNKFGKENFVESIEQIAVVKKKLY